MSAILAAHVSVGEPLVQATLVEEDEGEVVVAQRVGFVERKWKLLALIMSTLLIGLAILLSVVLSGRNEKYVVAEDMPSVMPSMSPSYDPAPTLQRVQERGFVRCGFFSERQVMMFDRRRATASGDFKADLCRAVAAVLFGNPDSFEGVPVTGSTRFQSLNNRSVDLLLYGDTHTIEREVREKTTGAGFSFSSPYYYDGVAYLGNKTFVECAEKQKRYDECASLRICSDEGSLSTDFNEASFPSDFLVVGSSWQEIVEMMLNGTCKVAAADQSYLLDVVSLPYFEDDFVVSGSVMSKSPLAIVTRNDDREFSDAVNWVIQALYFGEEQGLTKNASLCQRYPDVPSSPLDLNYLKAVHCVGNYRDITLHGDHDHSRGMNEINNGTFKLFATPFGEIEGDKDSEEIDLDRTRLDELRNSNFLRCGVVVPDGFTGNVSESEGLVGMSADYCRTLAAALFNGNYDAVEISAFPENGNDLFVALDMRTIDVLAGASVDLKHDLGSPVLGGYQFSSPYFYGNETPSEGVTHISLATREDDATFSSFANLVVLATIYAQGEQHQEEQKQKYASDVSLW